MIAVLSVRLRARLREEHGIALVFVLAAMVVVFALAAAAIAAVTYDTSGTASDTYQKQAYAAAQAGIQRYLFELNANNTYWTQCVPAGTNWLYNTGQAESPQPVPGSAGEKYAVMLLPAAGQSVYTACSTANPVDSMIQTSGAFAGTLRVASTGFAGNAKRTIVAAFKQQNFIDYTYFTNYETSDPLVQVDDAFAQTNDQDTAIEPPDQCAAMGQNAPSGCGSSYQTALTGGNVGTYNSATYPGATAQCSQYRDQGRTSHDYFKNTYNSGHSTLDATCADIQFINNDQINGPFHSNDSVLLCQNPTFGRSGHNDAVEFGGDPHVYPNGWLQNSGCSGTPRINGSAFTAQDTNLHMPAVNSLSAVASATNTYTGTTCINLVSSGYQAYQPTAAQPDCSSVTSQPVTPYPANGVIFVKNGACGTTFDVDEPDYFDSSTFGCGNVYVQGQDATPLTIGTDNDIIIDGNLTYSNSSAMLGLIATGFVRVYHPVSGGVCTVNGASNASGTLYNLTIDAMILSLRHSFIVDDYGCGSNLGTLTLLGGIAQNFRGAVGQGSSGYTKSYTYDSRLQYEEPPHFLAPTNGAFAIAHQTECDVAASCNS